MAVLRRLWATLAVALACLAAARSAPEQRSPGVAEVPGAAAPRRLWWWDHSSSSSGESGAGDGTSPTSILATAKEAFYEQLSAKKGQVNNAFVALLVGAVLLVNGELAFKWVLCLCVCFVMAVGAKNEVTIAWDLDSDDTIAQLVALEVGLVAAYVAWLGMEGIWIGLGIFLGCGFGHGLRKLLGNFGFLAFEENMNLVVLVDTVCILAVVYAVARKRAKVISIISPFFGGALVSSALAFFATRATLQGSMDSKTRSPVGGPWIDFLLVLFNNDSKDVGLFTNATATTIVMTNEPISRDRMLGLALWFVLFVIGIIIHSAVVKRSNAVAREPSNGISRDLQQPMCSPC